MLSKEIHLKNNIEKPHWNSKQCSSNSQEGRKKVIPVANERLMWVRVEWGGSGGFSISTPSCSRANLHPVAQGGRVHPTAFGYIGVRTGGRTCQALPCSFALGVMGVGALVLKEGSSPAGRPTITLEGVPCHDLG